MTWKGTLFIFFIAASISYLFELDTSLEPVENYVLNSQEVIDVVGKIKDADIIRTVYGALRKNKEYYANRYYLSVVGTKAKAHITVYVEYDNYKGIRDNTIVKMGIDEIRKR